MRVGNITPEEWKQFAPFVDTLCLPIFSLPMQGKEIFSEEGKYIEQIVGKLEQRLTGRMVLLPSLSHVCDNKSIFSQYLSELLHDLHRTDFYHIILITGERDEKLLLEEITHDKEIHTYVLKSQDLTEEGMEAEADRLYNEILKIWQS